MCSERISLRPELVETSAPPDVPRSQADPGDRAGSRFGGYPQNPTLRKVEKRRLSAFGLRNGTLGRTAVLSRGPPPGGRSTTSRDDHGATFRPWEAGLPRGAPLARLTGAAICAVHGHDEGQVSRAPANATGAIRLELSRTQVAEAAVSPTALCRLTRFGSTPTFSTPEMGRMATAHPSEATRPVRIMELLTRMFRPDAAVRRVKGERSDVAR